MCRSYTYMNHVKPWPLRYVSFLYVSIIACRPFETPPSFKRRKRERNGRPSQSCKCDARGVQRTAAAAVNGPRRFRQADKQKLYNSSF